MPTHVNSFNETRETLTWLNPPILAPPLTERCFRSTPKGVLTAQDYGVAVVGSWQISQRPLTVHKGEWGDRLLSRVMAWCLVHWTLSHWARVRCSGRKFVFPFFPLHLSYQKYLNIHQQVPRSLYYHRDKGKCEPLHVHVCTQTDACGSSETAPPT